MTGMERRFLFIFTDDSYISCEHRRTAYLKHTSAKRLQIF